MGRIDVIVALALVLTATVAGAEIWLIHNATIKWLMVVFTTVGAGAVYHCTIEGCMNERLGVSVIDFWCRTGLKAAIGASLFCVAFMALVALVVGYGPSSLYLPGVITALIAAPTVIMGSSFFGTLRVYKIMPLQS